MAVMVALSLMPVMLRFEADDMEPSSEVRVMEAVAVSPAARLSKPLAAPLSVMVRSAVVPVVAPGATELWAAEESREKEPTTRLAASAP